VQGKTLVQGKIKKKLKTNAQTRVGVKQFVSDTQAEMRRVSWPGKETVISATIIILVIVFFLTVFVSMVDVGFSRVLFFLKTMVRA
jgi:preprotein translocase subunit SecE